MEYNASKQINERIIVGGEIVSVFFLCIWCFVRFLVDSFEYKNTEREGNKTTEK